jgi:glutamate-ammonia-ligase adenylyltransferase
VLYADVVKMRARMRTELDRSDAARLDLKQGAGGIVDLEFLLQTGVLDSAGAHPQVLEPRDTPGLIDALATIAWLPGGTRQGLHDAHAALLDVGLACTLDRRPRLAAPTPALEEARAVISAACEAAGLPFQTPHPA